MAYKDISLQSDSVDRVSIAVVAAGVAFIAGYTTIRVALAQPASQATAASSTLVSPVVAHQGTLWQDVGPGL